jgi:hypothetical protein
VHLGWVEAGYLLRRLLAYTLRASRANYKGAPESLATRDAAYEDTLPLPLILTARRPQESSIIIDDESARIGIAPRL